MAVLTVDRRRNIDGRRRTHIHKVMWFAIVSDGIDDVDIGSRNGIAIAIKIGVVVPLELLIDSWWSDDTMQFEK